MIAILLIVTMFIRSLHSCKDVCSDNADVNDMYKKRVKKGSATLY